MVRKGGRALEFLFMVLLFCQNSDISFLPPYYSEQSLSAIWELCPPTTNWHMPRALPTTEQQDICHLHLWKLNPVLLQLLTFNTPGGGQGGVRHLCSRESGGTGLYIVGYFHKQILWSQSLYNRRTTQKCLNDPDNQHGMVTHLDPDILKWEVKWTLRRIPMNKASRGDGILAEVFQILKEDAVKLLYSICQQIWKTQQWPQKWKQSVFIPIPKKGNAKECSNYSTLVLISHARKVMLKILQARIQQYMNQELLDAQVEFWKGRRNRDQNVNFCWIIEKLRGFQKNIYFCFIDYTNSLTVWITTNWKIQEMGIPDHLTCLLRNLYAGQEATLCTRQKTIDCSLTDKAVCHVYCHPDYLIYMQSTSCEMSDWMKLKLKSRLPGKYQ